ncbi:MAG: 4-(cytidine 5'-diphospho)-2-C-methyl-D-erythritol kinase [Acidimicrobiia bacterium]
MNEVFAPAKLTLSLHVEGVRDDGYHELDALAVALDDPHDTLTVVDATRGVSIEVRGPAAGGVPATDANLAVLAARRVLDEVGAPRGVAIALWKEIPAGAGLGGGSSDAAGVLRTLGRAYGVPDVRLVELAGHLGSDVPACLAGGSVRMRGRGERLEPVELAGILRVVVVVPPFGCPTPAVYRAWDELGGPRTGRVVPAPLPVAGLLDELRNDLEPAAEHVEPRLRAFREDVEAIAGRPVLMAGSGSAYAICVDDEPDRWRELPARLADRLGVRAWAGATLPRVL